MASEYRLTPVRRYFDPHDILTPGSKYRGGQNIVSPATLEEDQELFVNFSLISYSWFEIQERRTYNFFDWVSNSEWNSTVFPWIPTKSDP